MPERRRKPTAEERRRHALISAWRGADEGPIMNLPALQVADLVGQVVAQMGLAERLQLEEVQAAWKAVVGDFLYEHSRPEAIQRGVLTVRILQPTVHHVLAGERTRLLQRLQSQLKNCAIREIRLKHG
jgi:hypothetical protein